MLRWILACVLILFVQFFPASAIASHSPTTCYDAKGALKWDGVTDDSANLVSVLKLALGQAGNGAACVNLPVGTGVLCQVDLPSFPNGLVLLGAGIGATTIAPCSPTTTIFSTAGREARYLEIGRFSIVARSRQSKGRFFDLRNVFNVNMHDIHSRNGHDFAYFEEGYEISICNTELRSFNGTAFYVNGGADFRWCSVNNYDDDDPTDGELTSYLWVQKGGGIILGAVDAIHCGNCYVFKTILPEDHIEWVFALQTQADTCSQTGWTLDATAGSKIIGFQAIGTWSASCGVGLMIGGTGTIDGISLIGPRIINNNRDGGVFQSGTSIDLSDPVVAGNGGMNPGTYSGLIFGPDVKNFTITGGRVGTFMQFRDTQRYNIDIKAASGRTYSIQNVNLCGNHPSGAAINDQSKKSVGMVRNNLCWNAPDSKTR